jgi:putative multiple sugar transport system permease protein
MKNGKSGGVSLRSFVSSNIRNYSMVLMLALIMLVFWFLTEGINLNSRNITNIFMQNSYILLLAVGMILVIIIGNIDLAAGCIVAFVGALSAMIYNAGFGLFPTLFLAS